uniref:Uncharacterized protein n=2 Tax=Aplanochytrium stocchinoi TaxID=215587 RepID=A0A7S3PI71_9STRA
MMRLFEQIKPTNIYYENASLVMQGQSNFDSGFEWGSWLSSVLTARSVYDIVEHESNDLVAFMGFVEQEITSRLSRNKTASIAMARILVRLMDYQYQTMVFGDKKRCQGRRGNCTAIAYIAGYDMYQDIGALVPTLNTAVGRVDLRKAVNPEVYMFFEEVVRPNLLKLEEYLSESLGLFILHRASVNREALFLFDEIVDALNVTYLRTMQVRSLYEFVGRGTKTRLWDARVALDKARSCIDRRQKKYQVPFAWVASWSKNPTVYQYRYLWTVKSMYYWWRDEAIATTVRSPSESNSSKTGKFVSPCFRNIENVLEELLQFPRISNVDFVLQLLRDTLHSIPILNKVTDCLSAPKMEPSFGRNHVLQLNDASSSLQVGVTFPYLNTRA